MQERGLYAEETAQLAETPQLIDAEIKRILTDARTTARWVLTIVASAPIPAGE